MLERLLTTILRISERLGISTDQLQQGETGTRIYVESEVPCAAVHNLTFEDLENVVREWGNAISLRLSSEFGIREFNLQNSELDANGFAGTAEDIHGAGAQETVRVRLTIDKPMLIRDRLRPRPGIAIKVLLFTSNLVRALRGELSEVAALFFSDTHWCCCLVLDEQRFSMRGPFFAVWGTEEFERGFEAFRPARIEHISEARAARNENVSWLDFETTLTPHQFAIAQCNQEDSDLYRSTVALQTVLTVLYLADTVRWANGSFIATFSGAERVQMRLRRDFVLANTSVLIRLFLWAYGGSVGDKLPIVRSVIASTLIGDRESNYELFGGNARRIYDSIRANYATFVGGFVSKYFDKVKEVDQYVRDAGTEIANRISDLVKSLTANLLGTVGVTVGAFVAYALDKRSSMEFLSVGLKIYAFYILVFPLFYSLLVYGLVDYLITGRDFERRTSDLELSLHMIGLTKKAQTSLKGRVIHFWVVFVSSVLIYSAIIVACFWIANLISFVIPPPSLSHP